MSNGIYGKIRRALHVTGKEPERLARVRARLRDHPGNLLPGDALVEHEKLIRSFVERLEQVEASTAHVDGLDGVASEIARFLIINDLPSRIRCGEDALLASILWSEQPDLQVLHGPAHPEDLISLTHAFAGVAETGTLFVASGPNNPVTLSFLPEINIVVVRLDDIVGCYEQAWQKLLELGIVGMPRTINLISGPSRTADIEQTLITGAHGPRLFHVIIVG